jgi:Tol biopolymer transport system component
VSPDGNLIAFQGLRPAPLESELDSLDIFVYDVNALQMTAVTETHGVVRKNHIPTFSSDGQWLLFVSDRTPVDIPPQWDYYALPINAGVVDTMLASTVRVTNSSNQIVAVSSGVVTPPMKSWNPVQPVLAVVMTTNALMQITMGASGGTTVQTPAYSGRVREISWAPDGSLLAYTNGVAIYTLTVGGTDRTLVHEVQGSDGLGDIGWSPDKTMMVYRVTRGATSWFELKEIGAPSSDPIVLTPSTSGLSLGSYRGQMSLAPVWLDSDALLLLQFQGDTPGIDLLDISAALQ